MPGKRAIYDDFLDFDVLPATTGGGAAKPTDNLDLVGATVQAVVSSGTVSIQASNDGSVWVTLVAAISASTIEVLSANYRFLRINTTTQPTNAVVTLHAHEFLY